MSLRTVVSILATLSIVTLKCDCSPIKEGVQIVTYGDPCVVTRQLPIKIEGPKPPRQEQKIPISLNLKVVSDMLVQPRKIEYPIEIEKACTTPPSVERMSTVDTLRGKTYTYNTYVPPASYVLPTQTNYNYAIEVPVPTKNIMEQYQEKRVRLKGLTSRIDRVLVPACEVPS